MIQTAILLAAGAGTRFWPYNVVRNKCAFPIANVPAVRRLSDDLAALGITRQVVVVGAGEASVRAALRGASADIAFVRQAHPDGTAAAAFLGAAGIDGDILVVAADSVTDRANLAALRERFERDRPLAAALTQPLGAESSLDWLIAYVDDGELRGVEGHSRDGDRRFCGVYAFRPEALAFLRDNPALMRVGVGGMPPVETEIAQSLQMMVDEGETVAVIDAPGFHVDLDKPWHILEANGRVIGAMAAALEGHQIDPTARVHDGADIGGRLVLGPGAVIGNRVVVDGDLWLGAGAKALNGAIVQGHAVIGQGTVVRDYCQIGGGSSLGARGVYGHGAEFSGVALDTVYCYHYCEIWGVVGQAVDFGAATVCGNLRFDDRDTVWRIKGRPEIPTTAANAAYFGDFCRTGVNAIIMPGRRLGVYSICGPGVILHDDLPDRTMIMVAQQVTTRPWGPERYGW
ncbi:sugar phosphate nucleotidyltransferase [Roseiflexus sp. RS-1]|uniref:sugar phosphate nucleotidyltransferase n=1 Tax=Roseiflexus sp. (strain RS-1) TaxID=357808 RepID=UPI0000D81517|nr:sugar phosphate nucleotidyltransferase [Roseiflexus sp. RS-1]ABQ89651.1 Nucleotidyl transferase [Roseiflexus sp. RS-1]